MVTRYRDTQTVLLGRTGINNFAGARRLAAGAAQSMQNGGTWPGTSLPPGGPCRRHRATDRRLGIQFARARMKRVAAVVGLLAGRSSASSTRRRRRSRDEPTRAGDTVGITAGRSNEVRQRSAWRGGVLLRALRGALNEPVNQLGVSRNGRGVQREIHGSPCELLNSLGHSFPIGRHQRPLGAQALRIRLPRGRGHAHGTCPPLSHPEGTGTKSVDRSPCESRATTPLDRPAPSASSPCWS